MAKNILIIAYAFPPIPYSGSYRSLRLAKELSKKGVNVKVLTINLYDDIPNDLDLIKKIPATVQVFRTRIIDPWRRHYNSGLRLRKTFIAKVLNRIISGLLRLITIPDHMLFWVPFAVWRGYQIIRQCSVETLVVSAPPYSSIFTALLLRKLTGVRLAVDLRDPIVGNVAEVNLMKPRGLIPRLEFFLRRRLEKRVVRVSEAVIANTETHKNELMEKYQQSCLVKINDEAFGIINPEGHWEQVHPDKIALGTNDTGCVYLVQPKTTRKDRTLAEWIDDKNNHHGKYIDGKFVRPWLPGQ